MKVLYDYQAFYMQRFGGVSNCFVRLIEKLPEDAHFHIAVCECNNIHLNESKLGPYPPALQNEYEFIIEGHYKLKRLLYEFYSHHFPGRTSMGRNIKCSIEALKKGDFDVFHPTFFDPYFLKYLNGKPFVLTVHDMISEIFHLPENKQSVWKKELIMKANHIIAVSEQTKQDLINMMNIDESMISVIYHGVSDNDNFNSESAPLVNVKYILFVGGRDAYKNFMPMMRNLIPVFQAYPELHLVCTGPDFTTNEELFFQQHHVQDRIIHLSPSDEGMRNLYEHALCFIFPSLYEGFGIPILESWQANCPTLLNHTSCFPEIAKDAAIYFQLDDNSSNLTETIEMFLRMEDKDREALLVRQAERLKYFSWEKSAKELYEVYKKVIDEHYGK